MKFTPEKLAELKEKFPPEYPMALENEMVPTAEVDWSSLELKELTCNNHPWSRYLTKDPFNRGLHFIQGPNGLDSILDTECECPLSDLVAVIRKDK
ncbi:MAG: hypothetical protein HMLIMOIP_002069 [Candidatus Nitrosomirales archaeon]|jgi:hypothetical protein